jgi:uncharacterized protein YkwD
METKGKKNTVWGYVLLFTLLLLVSPATYFIRQAMRGHPIDINYFWTELTPFGLFGSGLYNGNGGANWKIGKPRTTVWNASQLRTLPELRKLALEVVNRDRTINNLSTLVEDPLLSQAAQRHAKDMLKQGYFDHVSQDGMAPRDRFLAVGGSPRVGVGENIVQHSNNRGFGLTYGTVEDFQRGWMYSNGHRANILTPEYTRFGYGIEMGANGKIYAVQMFATD